MVRLLHSARLRSELINGAGGQDAEGKSMFHSTGFAAGDTVTVQLESEILKLMQADHGGWNDTMSSVRIGREMSIKELPLPVYT